MPIGFWAISRNELRDFTETLIGYKPTRQTLDRMVNDIKWNLEHAVEDIIYEFQARVITEHEEGLEPDRNP